MPRSQVQESESEYVRKVKGKTKSRLQVTPEGAEHITDMYAVGCTIEDIEGELGIGHNTLFAEHNRGIMEKAKASGQARMRNSLRHAQFEKAMSGDVKMLIFLGKQYLGQSDQTAPEPAPVSPIPDFVKDLQAVIREANDEWKDSEEYRAWNARRDREREEEERARAQAPRRLPRGLRGPIRFFSHGSLPFPSFSNCTYN